MIDFLTYDAKVAVLLAVFWLFYRLLLSRETFHRVNRAVLLLTAVGSFVLPLCVITLHQTVVLDAVPTVSVGDVQVVVADEPPTPWWHVALPALFFAGMAVTLGRTLVSVVRVQQLIRHSEHHRQADGVVVCVTDRQVSPFSWFRYIVLSRQDYAMHDAAVLAHERGHVTLRHSWDVLLVDTLTALQWFNPAMWLLRQDLRSIHEYEADGAVLSQGFNARQYQYLLITKAAGIGGYSIANGISHSTLKNRIHMMLHKKSKGSRLLKLLALLPIVGTALVLNAETVNDYQYAQPPKKQVIKKGKKNATIQTGGAVNGITVVAQVPDAPNAQDEVTTLRVDSVKAVERAHNTGSVSYEEMPHFPGGMEAMMRFLAENTRYPKEAMDNNRQGRVIVNFVVEKDGSIAEARVIKSVDPQLDAEAVRVVNSMPHWIPGMKDGEPVRTKFTIPVSFRLQGGETKPKSVNFAHVDDNVIVILDGVQITNKQLKDLNPGDIKSISVDKNDKEHPAIIIHTKKSMGS